MNGVCEASQRLCQRAPEGLKMQTETEVAAVRNDWDALNKNINERSGALEAQKNRWSEYEDLKQEVLSWLAEVEGQIKIGPDPKVDLVEKKAQLEKYRVT